MALVTSTKAHAQILSVDTTGVLRMPGVVDYISHVDVPASNATGFIFQDEYIFAEDKVTIYLSYKTLRVTITYLANWFQRHNETLCFQVNGKSYRAAICNLISVEFIWIVYMLPTS